MKRLDPASQKREQMVMLFITAVAPTPWGIVGRTANWPKWTDHHKSVHQNDSLYL